MTIQIRELIDWLIRGDIILIFRRMPTICCFFFLSLGKSIVPNRIRVHGNHGNLSEYSFQKGDIVKSYARPAL